jgi:hypothetical protein
MLPPRLVDPVTAKLCNLATPGNIAFSMPYPSSCEGSLAATALLFTFHRSEVLGYASNEPVLQGICAELLTKDAYCKVGGQIARFAVTGPGRQRCGSRFPRRPRSRTYPVQLGQHQTPPLRCRRGPANSTPLDPGSRTPRRHGRRGTNLVRRQSERGGRHPDGPGAEPAPCGGRNSFGGHAAPMPQSGNHHHPGTSALPYQIPTD